MRRIGPQGTTLAEINTLVAYPPHRCIHVNKPAVTQASSVGESVITLNSIESPNATIFLTTSAASSKSDLTIVPWLTGAGRRPLHRGNTTPIQPVL